MGAPQQRIGLYLFENQPWEKALIHAWRAGGHGELIGVSHTTMLDWNTRYFPGHSALASANTPSGMPLPDHVAVNGPLMRAAATLGGYDAELLIDVEALRFPAAEKLPQPQGGADGPLQLLVLGEYVDLANTDMLTVVVGALVGLECETRFRPHPARPESTENLPTGLVKDVSETLEYALEWADIVVCGPFSSTSLDARLAGKEPLIIASGRALESDPLHGSSSSPRCTSSNELTLIRSSPKDSDEWNIPSMVTFTRRLDSWRELIAGSQLPS